MSNGPTQLFKEYVANRDVMEDKQVEILEKTLHSLFSYTTREWDGMPYVVLNQNDYPYDLAKALTKICQKYVGEEYNYEWIRDISNTIYQVSIQKQITNNNQ